MNNLAPVILLMENVSRTFLLHRNLHGHLLSVKHRGETESWTTAPVYPLVRKCPQIHSTDLATYPKKRVGGDIKVGVTNYTLEEYLVEDTWKADRSPRLSKLAIKDM